MMIYNYTFFMVRNPKLTEWYTTLAVFSSFIFTRCLMFCMTYVYMSLCVWMAKTTMFVYVRKTSTYDTKWWVLCVFERKSQNARLSQLVRWMTVFWAFSGFRCLSFSSSLHFLNSSVVFEWNLGRKEESTVRGKRLLYIKPTVYCTCTCTLEAVEHVQYNKWCWLRSEESSSRIDACKRMLWLWVDDGGALAFNSLSCANITSEEQERESEASKQLKVMVAKKRLLFFAFGIHSNNIR